MRVGVPKEIKNHEYRVDLTPASSAGHGVLVETGADAAIGMEDAYTAAGAGIALDAAKSQEGRRGPRPALRTGAAKPRDADGAASTGVVSKALHILECVGLSGELSLAELKKRTGLPRSTLHRLVKLLVDERFLRRASPSHYRCTLKLWRIGVLAANYNHVDDRVQPVLRQLAEATGETAHYAVYEEGFSVYVAKADTRHPLRAGAQVGGRSPTHVSATGKAILAWRDESEIRRIGTGAKRFTAATIVGAEETSREAERVRRQGYAVSHGEWYEELWAVAAPIVDVRGNVASAIGVAGPTERFELNLKPYTDAVMRAAGMLSTGLRAQRKLEPVNVSALAGRGVRRPGDRHRDSRNLSDL